jgi:mRNA interferase RelE/StbE
MTYRITLKKKVIKELTKINEPYYSNIKEAIYDLADNPRPSAGIHKFHRLFHSSFSFIFR